MINRFRSLFFSNSSYFPPFQMDRSPFLSSSRLFSFSVLALVVCLLHPLQLHPCLYHPLKSVKESSKSLFLFPSELYVCFFLFLGFFLLHPRYFLFQQRAISFLFPFQISLPCSVGPACLSLVLGHDEAVFVSLARLYWVCTSFFSLFPAMLSTQLSGPISPSLRVFGFSSCIHNLLSNFLSVSALAPFALIFQFFLFIFLLLSFFPGSCFCWSS